MDVSSISAALSAGQVAMLVAVGVAIGFTLASQGVFSRWHRASGALRSSRNATAHPAPSLSAAPRIRVSRQAEWKLADPNPSLQRYKQMKAQGLR